MKEYAAIIVGGGASGMFCAQRLADGGVKDILLLERNDRLGRKLSATGNGQGNVTNIHMSAEHYFSDDPALVASVLGRFGWGELLRSLSSLGRIFLSDEAGRVYPTSRQAASVTDLLRFAIEGRVDVRTGARVLSADAEGDRFFVRTEGEEFCGRSLLLACGGKAAPHFGTDGSGYALARAFGHTVTQLRPSLVQLKTEQTFIRGLKGVRADCAVRIASCGRGHSSQGGRVCMRGDLLFTDYGVSGDAIFRLSAFCRIVRDLSWKRRFARRRRAIRRCARRICCAASSTVPSVNVSQSTLPIRLSAKNRTHYPVWHPASKIFACR